ncbi:hypothetical protein TEA_021951 [Camellia sinensis var. sinensis]|uniref:Pectinesterase inhibitor domain-containing protein n=1 Tax=Camellia sinensis var. sinensis TaxID=542762 RepID=A0A4S4DLB2_CAMSN|nr:hypothetical protein TEA_021951 [Camellia sinensis var. sinensis]
MLRNRMLADPNFLFKVGTGGLLVAIFVALVAIDSGCTTFAEFQKRGKDFWAEFELYTADLLVGMVVDIALVSMLAPYTRIGKPSTSSGFFGRFNRACGALPSSVFEAERPGCKFSMKQRIATYFYKGILYGSVGFGCGLIGQGIANLIMTAKRLVYNPQEKIICLEAWKKWKTASQALNFLCESAALENIVKARTALSTSLATTGSVKANMLMLKNLKGLKATDYRVLKDCLGHVEESMDKLSQSVRELKFLGQVQGDKFFPHQSHVQTWTSTALTELNDCEEGLSGKDLDGKLKLGFSYGYSMPEGILYGSVGFGCGLIGQGIANLIMTAKRLVYNPQAKIICLEAWKKWKTASQALNFLCESAALENIVKARTALSTSLATTGSVKANMLMLKNLKGLKATDYKVLKDCLGHVEESVDKLSQSVRELKFLGQVQGDKFFPHQSHVQTWTSTALTELNDCEEGLSRKDLDGKIKDSIRGQITNAKKQISNALATINQLAQ